MTPPEEIAIYDWLLSLTPIIVEPAVLRMGERHVIGFWVALGERFDTLILPSKHKGVEVLGWGASWQEAWAKAQARTFSTGHTSPAVLETASLPGYVCAEPTP